MPPSRFFKSTCNFLCWCPCEANKTFMPESQWALFQSYLQLFTAIYRWELFRSTSISWNLSLSYSIVFPFFFFSSVIGIPNWVQALSTTGDQTALDNVQWTRWEGLPEAGQHNDCCLQVRTLPKKRQGQVLWGKRQEEKGLYVQGKELCTCGVGKYSRPSKWK